jgi:adenosylcobinamide-phosphate synthase
VAATIESVAENASDSFVAPLFYYALFGVPGAIAYRAVNTLDAMIGYHGRYEYLGKASARLDDVLNWIPARITALLLVAAGWLTGEAASRGWFIWQRDGSATESPNAGRPMAVMAGLLGVELQKAEHYRLGDPVDPLSVAKIGNACRILHVAAALSFVLTSVLIGARHVYVH